MSRDTIAKLLTLVLLILIYSLPFLLALIYSILNFSEKPVFDSGETTPTILLTLATGQQVLVDWVQRLTMPLIAVFSVYWFRKDEPAPAPGVPPAPGGPAAPVPAGIETVRYVLLFFTIVMILVVVWDYIVIDNWSNLVSEDPDSLISKQGSDMRRYYSNAIESYLVIIAILVGVQLSQKS